MSKKSKKSKNVDSTFKKLSILIIVGFFLIVSIFELGQIGEMITQLANYLIGKTVFKVLFLEIYLLVILQKKLNLQVKQKIGITLINISLIIFTAQIITLKDQTMSSEDKAIIIDIIFNNLINLFSLVGTYLMAVVMLIIGLGVTSNFNQKTKEKIEDYLVNRKENKKLKKEQVKKEKIETSNSFENQFEIVIPNENEIKNSSESLFNKEQIIEAKNKKTLNDNVNESNQFKLPPLNLLNSPKKETNRNNNIENVKKKQAQIEATLSNFGISGKVTKANVGPVVTQYELILESGTKVSNLINIQNDLALALAAKDIRIEAPIPGKSVIGIEVPNTEQEIVAFSELVKPMFKNSNAINIPIGKDISNQIIQFDITKMPHLLIAGSTGSGKSVCINLIVASILMQLTPSQLKLIMIDPKKVELSIYEQLPHLLMPIVTDPSKAAITLAYVVKLMDERYDLFKANKVKNIEGYNAVNEEKIPYLVVIIDELADLMMVAKKEIEGSIIRITQMARAAGIHLIVATQRPSTDVITGIIKANIPSRIAFAVSSQVDSRTILDTGGAEKLVGRGDMLFLPISQNFTTRIQCGYITDQEIEKIVEHITNQQVADFTNFDLFTEEGSKIQLDDNIKNEDKLLSEVIDFVILHQKASASLIQRRFNIGFNRAANIVDELEIRGIIGPQNGSKPREVLVKSKEEDI